MKRNHRRKNPQKSYGRVHEVTEVTARVEGATYHGRHTETKDEIHWHSKVTDVPLHNGYIRNGRHENPHLDKSMHAWRGRAPLSGRDFSAAIGNDFSNGNRGMAKAVRGAKKFVRTRIRFHENQAVRRILKHGLDCDED